MPKFYNYITGEDEDIDSETVGAKAFYIVCLNEGLQTYKLCASPVDLNQLRFDPLTRITKYWPITRDQLTSENQAMWVFGDDVRKAPFSLDQIKDCFGFDPTVTPSMEFERPSQRYRREIIAGRALRDLSESEVEWSEDEVSDLEDLADIEARIDEAIRNERPRRIDPPSRVSDLGELNEPRLRRQQTIPGGDWLPDGSYETREMRIERIVQLSNGFITADQLTNIRGRALSVLLKPECIDALREHVLTLDDIAQVDNDLDALVRFSEDGLLTALREKLFSYADIADKDNGFIVAISEEPCLDSLREGRTNIQQLLEMSSAEIYQRNRTEDYGLPPGLGS